VLAALNDPLARPLTGWKPLPNTSAFPFLKDG